MKDFKTLPNNIQKHKTNLFYQNKFKNLKPKIKIKKSRTETKTN